MRKTCGSCEKPFEAKRPAAKYCSDRCRKRAQRRPQGVAKPPATPLEAVPVAEGSGGALTSAARSELEDAGRLKTAAGQAVLALARRIDAADAGETGSAVAALVREFRVSLEAATANAKKAEDPLDELRRKREQRLSG